MKRLSFTLNTKKEEKKKETKRIDICIFVLFYFSFPRYFIIIYTPNAIGGMRKKMGLLTCLFSRKGLLKVTDNDLAGNLLAELLTLIVWQLGEELETGRAFKRIDGHSKALEGR